MLTTPQSSRRPNKEDRDLDWQKSLLATARDDFQNRILSLSEEWILTQPQELEGVRSTPGSGLGSGDDDGETIRAVKPGTKQRKTPTASKRKGKKQKRPTPTRTSGVTGSEKDKAAESQAGPSTLE
jgi:hypothetical protein